MKNEIEVKEKTVFEFSLEANAHRAAIALCSAGFFVKISNLGSGYKVSVYQHVKNDNKLEIKATLDGKEATGSIPTTST